MADKEITDITSGGAATSGDLVHAVRGANSRSVTLGDAAGLNVGTGVSTVAAGDDSRFGTVPDKYVTDAKLRDSAALSVIGRAGNSSGVPADIAAASDHQVLRRSGTSLGFGAINLAESAAVTGILSAANLPAASTSAEGVVEKATDEEVYSASPNKYLAADHIETASAFVELTDSGSPSFDWDAGVNREWVLTANRTMPNPTNVQAGTYRTVLIKGNNSTGRTMSFGSNFKGDLPVLVGITDTVWYELQIFALTSSHLTVISTKAAP